MANMGSGSLMFHGIQSSNTASWPAFPGIERARESFPSRGQCCVTSQASSLNFCCSNVQSTSSMALERCLTKYANPIMSWCPRVFCMGKSGYLLLSNTGLLGIVCSCHCCHMSVSKFCEHSGLYGVNPGDAVRIESGETIAQWKKLYFLKFGIRSPGNDSEWDWPEVVSTAGNLMKFNASACDMSRSDLSHILSSAAVTLRNQPITIQNGYDIPLQGINAIMQNKQYPRVKSQLMETNPAIRTTASNFVGAQLDDGCQPITPFLDSRKRNGNLSNTHSTSQIPTSLLKEHECIKKMNAKDVLAGQDVSSSNIELRLGQPPRARFLVRSFTESPMFTSVSPPKLQSLKQMTNNHSKEEVLQNSFCHAAGSFKMLEEQPQLKPWNYMSGVSNASGAVTASSQTLKVAKSSSHLTFPQYNPQPKGKTKLSENLVNDGIMPIKLNSEYGTIQLGPTNTPWTTNGHTERQPDDFAPGSKLSNKFMSIDNGVSFAKDSCTKIYSGSGASQVMQYGSITRTAGGSGCCIPVVSGKNYESSFASDTSVGANVLHGPKNASSFGQGTSSALGTAVPFEGISKSLPYVASSSTPNLNRTSLHQQSNMDTYMLDENMRLHALTQILELSKQQHALYFHDMNQKQGRYDNTTKAQNYTCKGSVPEQGTFGASSKFPQNKGTYENLENTDDLNRYCHLSALTAMHLHSKEKELQCKRSYDLQNDGQSLSLGMNNSRSGKCSEQPSDIQFVGKYTNAAWANGCGNNFCTGIDPSCDIFKKQIADASGVTSLKVVSECGIDQNASKDENTCFDPAGNLAGRGTIKSGSHTPQWKDVPSKVRKSLCDAQYLDQVSTVLDCVGQDSVGNISAKRMNKTINMEDMLREQENFNVSSEGSAHVVSQTSVMEVNKVDFCTVDATGTNYIENLVIDEGSEVEKGWSSDVVGSERSAEFPDSTSGSYLKKGNLRVLNDQPCRSLLDELKLLDSLIWKKGRDKNHIMLTANNKTNQPQKVKKGFIDKKRKRNEVKGLDALLVPGIPSSLDNQNGESAGASDSPSSLSEEMLLYFSSSLQRSPNGNSIVQLSTKQGPSAFSSKFVSYKNHLSKHYNDRDSYESESNSDAEFHTLPKISGLKKLRSDFTSCFGHFKTKEPPFEEPKNALQKPSSSTKASPIRIKRPVVCGKYGEISSEPLSREVPKPVKIVSLSKVLKTSKRCMVPTIEKPKPTTKKKWRRLSFGTSSGHFCAERGSKTEEDNEFQEIGVFEIGSKRNVIYQWKRDAKVRQADIVNKIDVPLKVKSKEIRKQRSINEITAKETKVQDLLKYAEDEEHGLCTTKSENSVQEQTNICCVCQSSSNDKINSLLECSRCLIKVHQACYGVSKLPKRGCWCCRPCQTNSKDIACVLCGYGGGAMTRALSSHSIVKSLLKAWNFEKDGMPKHATSCEIFGEKVDASYSSETGWVVDQKCALMHENVSTSKNLSRIEMSTNHIPDTACFVDNIKVKNSITAGVLDSTVKQWVHMVCGLWTPGTRCPNVDTMSAFDVSSVSCPKADVVCFICNRWGGSCIECRTVDCSVKFHPWCAHQKNLLQGETEGANDENIGFYGRCLLHAIGPKCQSTYDPIDEMGSQEEKEFTCARTEGYRGRRCDGFQNNHHSALKPSGVCLVPEEQLNAWIHINGQKLCSPGIPKFPDSDIEHDCRKEYARYKQVKGWKHLFVYKSGIHALGLYTSQFISQGRMVVEYIGEIVGQRVADKRENEYQLGQKLQYKSACYFFRIDKEHIIDATRKGGIARFVNHSCLPNCVAKVITVRHEKKVVFFAERDIFPGEEITYDYHFNHEDEGKKIPCYCNSKNCRRFLN